MRIGDLLDELRRALPGCRLCAYVDLDVQLVLSFSAAAKPRQEHLDRLAQVAGKLLPFDGHTGKDSEPPLVSLLSPDRSLFLMRMPVDPREAICLECAPDANARSVASGAKLVLSWIGDPG